jgi:hypothetical protein
MLHTNDVFRSEPAIAALPRHVRKQAPSILLGQDELPPKGAIIVVVASKLGQHNRITITLSTNRRRR